MSNPLTPDELIKEIERLGPWYQRIEFPEYGITTNDKPEWGIYDAGHDNLFPGVDPSTVWLYRPIPKWERIRPLMPEIRGKTILEVGTSCGYFTFEFCRLGAKSATGIELDPNNVMRAKFCAGVFNLDNVDFVAGDVASYFKAHDLVFLSSVHEHFLYPFYHLTRLLCLAKEMLIMDIHHYVQDDDERICRLDLQSAAADGTAGSHAFHLSRRMFIDFLRMIGIDASEVEEKLIAHGGTVRRVLLCIDTKRFQKSRKNNIYLQAMNDID